jgi:sarcosine oxidase subunit alpha
MVSATVVPTPFYDPESERQKDAVTIQAVTPKKETA